jgi:hypothetical protein
MRILLSISLGATAATLLIRHVQRDNDRQNREHMPIAFLSTLDLRAISNDSYFTVERRQEAVDEHEKRLGYRPDFSRSQA